MSEYARREAIIKKLSRFCPICAAELIAEKKKFEARTVFEKLIASYTLDVTSCPNGHGTMDVGPPEGDFAPHAIFELDEKLFKEEGDD